MTETWVFYDTETNGLVGKDLLPLERQPSITEFAGLKMERDGKEWREVATLEFLVKPPIPVSELITRLTGITQEMVQDMPPWEHYAESVAKFFEDATHRCGHNETFDASMLDFECRRVGKEWRTSKLRQKAVCSVERTEHLKGYRLSLSDLHEYCFGEKFSGAHRAMVDVRATARVVQWLSNEGKF